MKYFFLLAALGSVFPFANWLRRNPERLLTVWTILGALPFTLSTGPHPLYIAIISWMAWPGYVKGAEFSAIDVLALAIYISQGRSRFTLPFRLSMAFYFTAILLSAAVGNLATPSLFYAWQLARMFLVYTVVTRACVDDRVPFALLKGMAIGIWFAAVWAVWQRIGEGILQAGGTVGEKNLLGLMVHFVSFPWFALLLAGQRGRVAYLAPLGAIITAVLTVSRASLGLTAAGMALIFVFSSLRGWTPRKTKVALLGALAVAAIVPIAVGSLESRFNAEPLTEYDERAAFESAAKMMVADHPMGVGANNYVVVANMGGYNERAHVAFVTGSLSTNVHNVYLLTVAETGYLGLVAFTILLLRPLITAFHCARQNRKDRRGDLLLGLGVSLLVVYVHCFFEWIFLTFPAQYLFAMNVGLVAGVAQQLGYWKRAQKSHLPMVLSVRGKFAAQ